MCLSMSDPCRWVNGPYRLLFRHCKIAFWIWIPTFCDNQFHWPLKFRPFYKLNQRKKHEIKNKLPWLHNSLT